MVFGRIILAKLPWVFCLVCTIAYGQLTVITFEPLAWSSGTGAYAFPDGYHYSSAPYSEAGFTITPSTGTGFCIIATDNPYLSMGSMGLSECNDNGVNTLTKNDGGTFTISSIDLAPFGRLVDPISPYGGGALVPFTGTKADGSTVSVTFTAPLTYNFQTYRFPPTFTGLVALSWRHLSPYHQYDNITLISQEQAPSILVLNRAASNALVASGSAVVTVNGSVVINSSAPKALVVSGGASLTAQSIQVVGNYSGVAGAFNPAPQTGVAPLPDPLRNLQLPPYSGCDFSNTKINGGTTRLTPGVYCGGITISSATVTFTAGTYILNGGGLTISGGSSAVTGDGLTFLNTSNGYAYKPITISGGGYVNLSATTSGMFTGILFFQDRNITSSSQNTISGGSTTVIGGTLYFPTTKLVYSGGSGSSGEPTTIIADTLSFSGPSYIQSTATIPGTLTVAKSGTGTGAVLSSPAGIDCGLTCTAPFSGVVQLTAVPDSGSAFAGWGGDCSGSFLTATVTVTTDRSCTATFGPATPPPTVLFTATPGTGPNVSSSSTRWQTNYSCPENTCQDGLGSASGAWYGAVEGTLSAPPGMTFYSTTLPNPNSTFLLIRDSTDAVYISDLLFTDPSATSAYLKFYSSKDPQQTPIGTFCQTVVCVVKTGDIQIAGTITWTNGSGTFVTDVIAFKD